MNILVISQHSADGLGGPAKYLENLLLLLQDKSHRIHLLSFGGISSGLNQAVADVGAKIVEPPPWGNLQNRTRLFPKLFGYVVEALSLNRAVTRMRPRIDLLVVSHCSPGRYLLPWGPLGGAVLIYHSEPVGRKHRLAGPLLRFLLGRNSKLVAVSEYVANEILATWARGSDEGRRNLAKRLVTLRHPSFEVGIQANYVPHLRREVLMAGGANWYKNPWLWLRVAELVIGRSENRELTFRWIGDGPLLEDMRRHVRRIGLTRRIILPGHVKDVRPAYESARLYLHLSVRESMGIAAVDALRAALPMVVSNVGGLPETVDSELNGLIVSSSNPEDIADCVAALLDDPVRLTTFSRASRAKFLAEYDAAVWKRKMRLLISESKIM